MIAKLAVCGVAVAFGQQQIGGYAAPNTVFEAPGMVFESADDRALAESMGFVQLFEEFIAKFGKAYHSLEQMMHRLKVFLKNLLHIKKAQKNDPKAKYSHMSPFADWTPEEFQARNTLKKPTMMEMGPTQTLSTEGLPKSIDWRTKGAVNTPKDQGQCGSCWAFGTVANIEGAYVVQGGGPLLSLSEQELVDCSSSDNGCNGGLPARAYRDMIDGGWGLDFEKDYGYHAREGICKKSNFQAALNIQTWIPISQDERQIAAALVKYGPLAIGVNANPFQFYSSGIMDPEDCSPYGIDHAVNLVGYGEEDGTKYWIIRNSWGSNWGERGYVRIVRGVGKCGLNLMVTTAIFTKQSEIVV